MVADAEHDQLTIDILEKYSKTADAQAEVREGYFFKIDLRQVILDAVYLEYVLKDHLKLP